VTAFESSLLPGQTGCLRGGVYAGSWAFNRSGTASARITIQSYPGETAVLDAAGALHTLVVTGDYLVVKGLKVQGATGTRGVGLYLTQTANHDSIVQNELTGNQSSALFSEEESHHIVIDRNRIHDNCCVSGMQTHGIYLQGDDQQVTNNLIYAHPNGFGIQVYDYGRRIRVVSNTVDGSRFAPIVIGGSGSGPEGTGVSNVDVVNNIGTSSPSGYGVQCYENPTNYRIHDNLFFGVQLLSNCTLGAGNVLANPLYVGGGDYHLLTGSPGIDSGDNAWLYGPDFAGSSRPQGARVDKGAYER
jgi:hypothetical protein